jgi:hypothetical protein
MQVNGMAELWAFGLSYGEDWCPQRPFPYVTHRGATWRLATARRPNKAYRLRNPWGTPIIAGRDLHALANCLAGSWS